MNSDPIDFFNISSDQDYLPFGHQFRIQHTTQPNHSQTINSPHQKKPSNTPPSKNTNKQLNGSQKSPKKHHESISKAESQSDDSIVIDFGDKVRGKTCKDILDNHEDYRTWLRWLKFDYEKVGAGKIDHVKKVRQYFSQKLPNWNEIKSFNDIEESKKSLSRRNSEIDDDLVVDFGGTVKGKTCKEILANHEDYRTWFRWLKFDHEKVSSGKINNAKKVHQYFSQRLPYWNDIKSVEMEEESPKKSNKSRLQKVSEVNEEEAGDDDDNDNLVINFGDKVKGKTCKEILDSHEDYYTWFRWLKFEHEKVSIGKMDVARKAHQYFSQRLDYWDDISSIDGAEELPTRSDRQYDNDDNIKVTKGKAVYGMTFKQILENHEQCENWLRWLKYKSQKSHYGDKILAKARKYFEKHLKAWHELKKWDEDDD